MSEQTEKRLAAERALCWLIVQHVPIEHQPALFGAVAALSASGAGVDVQKEQVVQEMRALVGSLSHWMNITPSRSQVKAWADQLAGVGVPPPPQAEPK